MTTVEYFGLSKEELKTDKGNGWTKEDCLLADASEKTSFSAGNYTRAEEIAEWRKRSGYKRTQILKTICGDYAILAWS